MPRPRLSPEERARRLERLQRDYEAAKARLEPIGFICEGSLVEVYHCCHKPNCRCANTDQRHGPYRQLSWKEGGKTVSVRLGEEEALLYNEWITNRRALDAVIAEMRSVSREAAEHILGQIGHSYEGPLPPSRSGQSPGLSRPNAAPRGVDSAQNHRSRPPDSQLWSRNGPGGPSEAPLVAVASPDRAPL